MAAKLEERSHSAASVALPQRVNLTCAPSTAAITKRDVTLESVRCLSSLHGDRVETR